MPPPARQLTPLHQHLSRQTTNQHPQHTAANRGTPRALAHLKPPPSSSKPSPIPKALASPKTFKKDLIIAVRVLRPANKISELMESVPCTPATIDSQVIVSAADQSPVSTMEDTDPADVQLPAFATKQTATTPAETSPTTAFPLGPELLNSEPESIKTGWNPIDISNTDLARIEIVQIVPTGAVITAEDAAQIELPASPSRISITPRDALILYREPLNFGPSQQTSTSPPSPVLEPDPTGLTTTTDSTAAQFEPMSQLQYTTTFSPTTTLPTTSSPSRKRKGPSTFVSRLAAHPELAVQLKPGRKPAANETTMEDLLRKIMELEKQVEELKKPKGVKEVIRKRMGMRLWEEGLGEREGLVGALVQALGVGGGGEEEGEGKRKRVCVRKVRERDPEGDFWCDRDGTGNDVWSVERWGCA